eukprot:5115017-Ditylum_brightwellii.AAC.1
MSKAIKYNNIPSKKPTYNTRFEGCPGCQTHIEGTLNVVKQMINHGEITCILLNNPNIIDKMIREAWKQHNAK